MQGAGRRTADKLGLSSGDGQIAVRRVTDLLQALCRCISTSSCAMKLVVACGPFLGSVLMSFIPLD